MSSCHLLFEMWVEVHFKSYLCQRTDKKRELNSSYSESHFPINICLLLTIHWMSLFIDSCLYVLDSPKFLSLFLITVCILDSHVYEKKLRFRNSCTLPPQINKNEEKGVERIGQACKCRTVFHKCLLNCLRFTDSDLGTASFCGRTKITFYGFDFFFFSKLAINPFIEN